ncbi:hypothetical protein [Fluviispira multicolorata]|uniref:Uncharacterized protein n=1 Tax=Fluviispira multicolorata TaxID=2654512 RepID=A0A833JED7_9BACT|nr:hypothetical protein [Fluviispira multicolorata]KAB8033164.1 hypothetical protein GCL57_00270 [Fluviispira multicolorata]
MKFILKISFPIILGLTLISAKSKYSTKWNISNNSKESIILSCKNKAENGPSISMTTKKIEPKMTQIYDWGDTYYNDGLWLNAGTWQCSPQKNEALNTKALETFSTDWGESISLVLSHSKGELTLTKVLNGGSAAIAGKDSANVKTKVD